MTSLKSPQISRRDFLKLSGTASLGLALSACSLTSEGTMPPALTNTPTPTNTLGATPTPTSTLSPTATLSATPTSTPSPSATPDPFTLRRLGEKLGIVIGTAVDHTEDGWELDKNYASALKNHFGLIMPAGAAQDKWFNPPVLSVARRRANQNSQILHLQYLYNQNDVPQEVKGKSETVLRDFMKERADSFLNYTQETTDERPTTYITWMGEAMWQDPWDTSSYGRAGYTPASESEYYRIFGNNVISETYIAFIEEANRQGLVAGKDFRMIYSDYNIFRINAKARLLRSELARAKESIAKRLNKRSEDVQIDIAIQCHFEVKKTAATEFMYLQPPPTESELEQAVDLMQEIGRVHLVEVNVLGTSDPNQISDYLRMATRVAARKRCNLSYWSAMRLPNNSHGDASVNPFLALFDTEYHPNDQYRMLVQELTEVLGK